MGWFILGVFLICHHFGDNQYKTGTCQSTDVVRVVDVPMITVCRDHRPEQR